MSISLSIRPRLRPGPGFSRMSGSSILSLAVACVSGAPLVYAQDARQDQATVLEEVYVTATRRSERLSDIPQAISALTDTTMIDNGFDSLADFAGQVPSLNFTERGPGKTSVNIRGVSADPGTNSVSTVGIYVDETPITNDTQDSQAYVSTFDLERVEILRGPQGTLYGEGAMGGVVRYITHKPDMEAFSGALDLSVGRISGGEEDYAIEGAVNIPVTDNFGIRLSGFSRREGGYIDNPVIGAEDFNSADIHGGRINALWMPSDVFEINAMAMFSRIDVDGDNITRGGNEDEFIAPALNPRTDDYDLFSLTLRYEFSGFTATSITSYSERDATLATVDSDLAILFFVAPFQAIFSDDPVLSSVFNQLDHTENFTQEIRLVSTSEGSLKWTAGLWYRDGDFTDSQFRDTGAITYGGSGDVSFLLGLPPGSFVLGPNPLGGTPGTPIPGGFSTDSQTSSYENTAVFGEVSYDITPQLELLLGGRWFEETRSRVSDPGTGGLNEFLAILAPSPPLDQEFEISPFTPKATVSYRPDGDGDDTLFYLTYATGVRSGGQNSPSDVGLTPRGRSCPEFYDEDTTSNFELGGKTSFFNGAVVVAGAAFYTDWDDLQVLFFDADTFNSCVDNAGAAHSMGVEVEVAAQLSENLTLTVGGNVIEAELDEDIPGADTSSSVIAKGTDLPNVPKYKFGASLRYEWPFFADWSGVITANFSAVGESQAALEPGLRGDLEQPAYQIFNARIGMEKDNISAFFVFDNLTDEYAVLADDTFGGIHRNKPRTIGFNLRMSF